VHAALALVAFAEDGEAETRARAAVEAHARTLGATSEETEAAATLVARALAHPVIERAAAAGGASPPSVRREVPVFLREPDGTLVEGVADLAFREVSEGTGRWIVVDYKTDRSTDRSRARYEAQVRRYAAAVGAATGESARGVVLAL
jgi:ATP-dependent exoDNAse (exonuclease V) beta subunit